MARTTRKQFLDTAETQFAARGFYGTSVAAIAGELGLTKQAILHHFGSKEKLYGEVLERISKQFEALGTHSKGATDSAPMQLKIYLIRVFETASTDANQTRLLMRELLDNNQRAETATQWFLKPFLEKLITMIKAIPNWQSASDAEALALIYQLLGAINYFGISEPTLTAIFGQDAYAAFDKAFPDQLERLIDGALAMRN